MTLTEAIDVRHSRRNYQAGSIPPARAAELRALLDRYNKEAAVDMRLVLDDGSAFNGLRKSYGMFSGVQHYIGLIEKTNDPDSQEKLGYYGELVMLQLVAWGYGTCWVGGTFDRKICPFTLAENERIVCTIPFGPVADAPSKREAFIRNLTHRKIKTAEQMYQADTAVPDWFLAGVHAAQKAPSAVNRQPVCFTWKDGVVTASVQNADIAASMVDLGIAKAHFDLVAGGRFAFGNGAVFDKEEHHK